MSLTLALNNALTGLSANQRALSVLSHNISNANTPGYSRQIVDQSAVYIDGVGSGVSVDEISRKIDVFLQRAIRDRNSDFGQTSVINDYYERAQIYYGQPGLEDSLDEKVEAYMNALQNLAETPDVPSFRVNAVSAGASLARDVSTLAGALEDLRYQADRDINEGVKFVNDQLKELAALNVAINRAHALNNSTAGLSDQRDAALKKISEYMDIKPLFRDNGEVFVYAADGIPLLEDDLYQLQYAPATSVQTFIQDGVINKLTSVRVDENFVPITTAGAPYVLATEGRSSEVTTLISSGKFKGYMDLRDELLPNAIAQLDSFSAVLRDEVNRVHNQGSGYPGATELSGTREVFASDQYEWAGKVRIAVLDVNGDPVTSAYADESNTGFRPLTLDLEHLNSGQGAGFPTVQSIIDEINWHFGPQPPKAEVGLLNNITMVSNSTSIPGPSQTFNIDFELENISGDDADFWVTDVQVLDDTAANIGSTVTSTLPQVALDPANTYTTIAGQQGVTVRTNTTHNFVNGQTIYLSDPGAFVDGIPNAELTGYFVIDNVTANTFTINTTAAAVAGGSFGFVGETASPRYDEAVAGEKSRTNDQGTLTLDLAPNPFSTYYDVQATVGVRNANGTVTSSVITYRVLNNTTNNRNDRYAATANTAAGGVTYANTNQDYLRAVLVDEDGVELPKINGAYSLNEPGFVKLISGSGDFYISIDELDSEQLGLPNQASPAVPGTNRGFSHYFELNNFFQSNVPTSTGDTVKGSAINMAVESRITRDPNLISTGKLTRSNQPSDPNLDPIYTYSRFSGDNDVAQALAKLSITSLSFTAAGGLPQASQTLSGYAGQLLGFNASQSATAENHLNDTEILLEGFTSRSDAISGVNLDEELANTILYQNAYSATARIISVVNAMFDELVNIL